MRLSVHGRSFDLSPSVLMTPNVRLSWGSLLLMTALPILPDYELQQRGGTGISFARKLGQGSSSHAIPTIWPPVRGLRMPFVPLRVRRPRLATVQFDKANTAAG
jgi:hypothetical protein